MSHFNIAFDRYASIDTVMPFGNKRTDMVISCIYS